MEGGRAYNEVKEERGVEAPETRYLSREGQTRPRGRELAPPMNRAPVSRPFNLESNLTFNVKPSTEFASSRLRLR